MTEHFKAPEKIQLSEEERANLSRCTVQNSGYQDAHRIG